MSIDPGFSILIGLCALAGTWIFVTFKSPKEDNNALATRMSQMDTAISTRLTALEGAHAQLAQRFEGSHASLNTNVDNLKDSIDRLETAIDRLTDKIAPAKRGGRATA